VKAYGRPTDGGRGTYVSFAVPDSPELTTLIADAAPAPAPCGPRTVAPADPFHRSDGHKRLAA
jgi:hypothetical protein